MAFSFSQTGSTPNVFGNSKPPVSPLGIGSTPQAKALSGALQPSGQYVTPRPPTPPAIPSPSTPVKKTTVNNVDGTSHTTEYHTPPPTPGLLNTQGKPIAESSGSPVPTPPTPSQQPPSTPPQTASQQPTTQPSQAATPPNFSGMLGGLSNFNPFSNPAVSGAYQNAQDARAELQNLKNQEAEALKTAGSQPMPIGELLGRQGLLATYYTAKEKAAADALAGYGSLYQGGLAGTGQQQQAQSSAAGLAQPQLASFNQQVFNPATGQLGTGGSGGLPQEAQTFIGSLAQQVRNGQMTRDAAASQIAAYGQPGLMALNTALGSDFNTNASNASAATTATGQQIQAAIGPATQALDSLQEAFNGLNAFQQGSVGVANVPLVSQLAQNASLAFGPGREAASAYQGALQEARSRIDAALVGSIGVNAAAAQANALLPDNMLPNEIPQKIAAAKQYLQNQLSSYTSSGQQNTSNAQSTTNPPGWF